MAQELCKQRGSSDDHSVREKPQKTSEHKLQNLQPEIQHDEEKQLQSTEQKQESKKNQRTAEEKRQQINRQLETSRIVEQHQLRAKEDPRLLEELKAILVQENLWQRKYEQKTETHKQELERLQKQQTSVEKKLKDQAQQQQSFRNTLQKQQNTQQTERRQEQTNVEQRFKQSKQQVQDQIKKYQQENREQQNLQAQKHYIIGAGTLFVLLALVFWLVQKHSQAMDTLLATRKELKETENKCVQLEKLTAKLEAQMNHSTASLVFKMDKLTESTIYNSPSFFTHPKGYKMQVSVNANVSDTQKNTHVSVHVYLMKGDFDDDLEFPIIGITISCELLNQLEDKNHHKRSFTYRGTENSTERVMTGKIARWGWGFRRFIHQSNLTFNSRKNCQYLKDDSLVFRITTEVPFYKRWLQCTNC